MKPGKRASADKKRVLLLDDHPCVREHLARLIELEPDLAVCAQAADGPEALAAVAATDPHLAIVDLSLGRGHGLEVIKDLRVRHPALLLLVLSTHEENLYAERCLRAGARGYVTKREASGEILAAIRTVLGGSHYLSKRMMGAFALGYLNGKPDGRSPVESLSDREMEIFEQIGRGRTVRQIAADLRLDKKTIETYRGRIKEKLQLADAAAVLQHAISWVQSRGFSALGALALASLVRGALS